MKLSPFFKTCMVLSPFLFISCGDDEEPLPEIEPFNFISQVELESEYITDVWEYVDPSTNKVYAIVGDHTKYIRRNQLGSVYIVDVTAPDNPSIAAIIDSVDGFDMKIWQNYLYVANGAHNTPDPSAIFDLSDISNPVRVGTFHTCHNIFIDGRGYLYTEGSEDGTGMNIFNLNNDPENPQKVWNDNTNKNGHDVAVIRNRIYDFHSENTLIYDASDPKNPILLSTIDDPNVAIFHHSGWVSGDDNILFIADETNRTSGNDVTIWDISNLASPEQIGAIRDDEYQAHNLYIIDNLAYMSFYGGGFRVYDIQNPRFPSMIYTYDTWKGGAGIGSFRGAFGTYPFSESGNIYVSDINNGLFIFNKN